MGGVAVVRLAPLGRQHLTQTRAWANDPELMRLMDRARPVAEDEHEAWFASLGGRDDREYFAIEDGAQHHLGNVWLWAIDRRHRKAEVRIVVGDAAARGRGVGPQAIDAVCRHAVDNLGLHRAYAYVLTINPAARRAFEKARFRVEGLLADDRWNGSGYVDAWLLARLAEPSSVH